VETPTSEIPEKNVGLLQSSIHKGYGGTPIEKDNILSGSHGTAQTNDGMRDGSMNPPDVFPRAN